MEESLDRMVCWSAEFNYVTPSHDSTQSIIKTSCLQISTQKKELKEKKKKRNVTREKLLNLKTAPLSKSEQENGKKSNGESNNYDN